jgi:hypothetical protein
MKTFYALMSMGCLIVILVWAIKADSIKDIANMIVVGFCAILNHINYKSEKQ